MNHSSSANPDASTKLPRCLSDCVKLWGLVLISYLWMVLTSCICGHTSWVSGIGIISFFCCAAFIFFGRHRSHGVDRILSVSAFALILAMVLKNAADILYFGHTPLLR